MYFTKFFKAGLGGFLLFFLNLTLSNAQDLGHVNGLLQPSVSADKTTGCAPEAVRFSLTNAGNISQLKWIIGKDTIKNADAEQTYLFSNAGIYTVAAKYKKADGNDTTILKQNFIKLGKGTNPLSLKASRNYICNGPDTVRFSAFAAGAAVYDWIIDGTNYLDAGPTLVHKFQTPGTKTVTIRIKDSSGCYGLQIFNDVVLISVPPKMDFMADVRQGCLPLQVNFSQKITKGSADIVSWKWEFPGANQTESRAENPENIIYNTPGKYDVNLTVTTKDGCTFSSSKKAFISVGDTLTPKFQADKTNICPGDVITYTNLSAKPATGNLVWSFPGGKPLSNSTEDTQYVQYSSYGNFKASLSYVNGNCNRTTTLQNAAVVERLKADFTADDFCNCRVPDTINFINKTLLPATGTATYEWTFYDADGETILATTTAKNPALIYTKYGRYAVKLVVKHSNGCSDSVVKSNFLTFEEIQIEDVHVTCDAGCVGKDLGLKLSQLPNCGNTPYSYEWIVYKKGTTEELTRLYGEKPKIKLYDTGFYDVKLLVQNGHGCVAEKSFAGLIKVVIPEPDFTADTTQACQDEKITLIQKTTPGNLPYTHDWKLVLSTDSSVVITGSGKTFTPAFTKPGIYHVTYTAGFSDWCHFPVTKNNYLKISGISADFSAEKQDGCLPFSTSLKANVSENKHYGFDSDSVNYQWSANPAAAVRFSDANNAETKVTFNSTGYYAITLKVTNSSGCDYTVTKNNFFCAGIRAAYTMSSRNCFGSDVPVVNHSSRNAALFQWSSSQEGVKFSPSSKAKNPVISFSKGGKYNIKLVSKSAEGCSDSIIKTIIIDQVNAQFSSGDTLNTCAPAYVSFSSAGTGADSFIWYFGDGEMLRTKDTNIAHIYTQNTGDKNTGYDVMLIAKSNSGCVDTILKKKYIKVLGPVPAFSIANAKGCEPLLVNFSNQSKNTLKYYLDFGDFSQPDTSSFGPHFYTVKDPDAAYQVFKPRLLAKDEFGCSVWAFPQDSIVVYRKPKAAFSTDNNEICAGEAIQFTNNSAFGDKFSWDFNNDGKIDDTTRNPKAFLKPGIYSVKLVAENKFGCSDSVFVENAFTVFAKPQATISASADTVCAGSSATFKITSTNNIKIKSYKWFLNDVEAQNTGSESFTKAFFAPGIYSVSAEITSENGCVSKIKLNKTMLVPDTAAPATPEITYISVEKNASISIHWAKNQENSFAKYKLYKKTAGHFVLIFSSTNCNETQYLDVETAVNKESYSYKMVVENFCGKASKPSEIHTSVLLKVAVEGKNRLQLNWSAYKGWKNVKYYNIYRSEGAEFQILATVDGKDTAYTDNGLCDHEYAYKIEAVNEKETFASLSNKAAARPEYFYNTTGEDVRFATVTEDDKILLQWTKVQNENPKGYIIDRFENGKGWTNNYAYAVDNEFTDNNVRVNEKSYAYRIKTEDRCGKITNTGEIGKSILLKVEAKEDVAQLSWTKYGRWKNGIRQYRIEIQNLQNDWELVAFVNGADTFYTDAESHDAVKMPYIYRVVAEENGAENIISTSNKAEAILKSHIYVPNAFSPNQDGINEEFKAVGRFIKENAGSENHNFQLTIFNRWGEKVFESNRMDKGWDGTFKGSEAQEGTYIYLITAFGYDKQSYYLQGNISLLR